VWYVILARLVLFTIKLFISVKLKVLVSLSQIWNVGITLIIGVWLTTSLKGITRLHVVDLLLTFM